MENVLNLYDRVSKPWVMGASFVLFALLLVLLNRVFVPDFRYLTQTFNYTPDTAYSMMDQYGAEGRGLHIKVLFADVLMVLIYIVFFSTTVYATFSTFVGSRIALSVICLIPVVLAIFQLTEVVSLFILLLTFPAKHIALMQITNVITMIKFVLTYICFVLPVIGVIGFAVRKLFFSAV